MHARRLLHLASAEPLAIVRQRCHRTADDSGRIRSAGAGDRCRWLAQARLQTQNASHCGLLPSLAQITLLIGPRGAGNTVLAQRLPTILPPLGWQKSLAAARCYSVPGKLPVRTSPLATRPLRRAHHSISVVALVDGGTRAATGGERVGMVDAGARQDPARCSDDRGSGRRSTEPGAVSTRSDSIPAAGSESSTATSAVPLRYAVSRRRPSARRPFCCRTGARIPAVAHRSRRCARRTNRSTLSGCDR